jgi:membrane-bound lytic murein transglycosylase D
MYLRPLVFPILLFFLFSGCSFVPSDLTGSLAPDFDEKSSSHQSYEYQVQKSLNSVEATETEAAISDGSRPSEAEQTDSAAEAGEESVSDVANEPNTGENVSPPAQKVEMNLDDALELCQLSQDFWQQGELERALEALDRAYALILAVDTSDQPKLIQQKEDLRFLISKRILEIYASRNIVLNGNHNAIPVTVNRHVQAEIDLFTTGRERRSFINAYKRSGRYRPAIVKALKEAGLPRELSWLPLIESGYKVNALSPSRALGLWQFIPSTGYKFGLNRDKYIDERMDPEKSTEAAIEYLKELHGLFGDWATVLAAYNCGEGRVLRVIRSQNINYLDNFWDLYQRLPQETARYVPRFLATLHVINNLEKYGMDQIEVDPALDYETVIANKQVHLKHVARSIGVPQKTLEELNAELRYKITPSEDYKLRLPPGTGNLLLSKFDRIPVSHPPQRAFTYHRVRHGETLSVIARRYRTSVGSIMRANNLRRSNYIVAGKRLKIPQRGYTGSTVVTYEKPKNGQTVTHTVRKGDSLYIIAKHYGTTTKKIQELNNLTTTMLHIGQVLTIFPGKDITPPPEVDGLAVYEVRMGDSPFVIAKRHKMSLDRFLYLNQLYPESKIFPGQKLYIE